MSRSLIALPLAVLMIAGCDRQSPTAEQAADAPPASPAAAPAPAGQIDRSHKGTPALAARFKAPDGQTVTLADFRGRPVLLNLWATWCAPCIVEMPALDRLAARGGATPLVLTVSQDFGGAAKVGPFFAKGRYEALKPYLDEDAALSLGYQVNLPASILFDKQGREVWRTSGPRDWTSAETAALLAEAQ